jgi:hypothetical protein
LSALAPYVLGAQTPTQLAAEEQTLAPANYPQVTTRLPSAQAASITGGTTGAFSAVNARRERRLTEAVEQSLTKEERALLFKAGELLDRIAAYPGSGPSNK